jgi:hypothetical protein
MALLAGYLLFFPPLFVLGPLAGLLLASRPGTLREWAWISAAGLWLALSLYQPGGLAMQAQHAWALLVTAGFVVLMLSGHMRVVSGALWATVAGLGLVTLWARLLGTRWQDIQIAVAHQGWEACRALLAWGQTLAPEQLPGLRTYLDGVAAMVAITSDLLPAVLVLRVLPGLALAWGWYHRLAFRPAGAPAERFADFRFNDQLVWAVVGCVAVWVLPVPAPVRDIAGNVGLVLGGLYVARGVAITWTTLETFPFLVLLIVGVGMLFILPVALGGSFALGLADTWVDFRRRLRPANQTRE